jgi:hypothetical protein
MTNLIAFPGRRRAPPAPIVDELTALETELVRARIAQVRTETRYVNSVWFWSCFKKALFWGVVLWLLAMVAGAARAQSTTRSFYDSSGSFAGSSTTRGTSSTFYGSNGSFAGSATRQGKWTNFYDAQGRYNGTSIGTSPRR